jgi:small subunit ribosomal protein S15
MSVLTTERKKELFATYGGSETNTGSTKRKSLCLPKESNIFRHMQKNKKDFNQPWFNPISRTA